MDLQAKNFPGYIGFYVKDLTSGVSHEYDADRQLPSASICKIPILIELYQQVEKGLLSLDTRFRLRKGISTHGTGVLRLLEDLPELTLRDYCRLMIGVSDNMATDLLLEVLGIKTINSSLDSLGFRRTRINMTMGQWHYLMVRMENEPCNIKNDALMMEKVRTNGINYNGLPFLGSSKNNVATARDMGEIMEQLYEGHIISSQASTRMINMLKRCESRSMIPRDLMPEIIIAHKHGSSSRIKGDVGLLFLPTGPLVISVLTLAKYNSFAGSEIIAKISRLAVKSLSLDSISQ